ncbi:MAG: hypothetical protein Q4E05_05530 [Pseudoclavibacter sp.]|nr:hypothetical protein [Pseudoclavibacter sp.]
MTPPRPRPRQPRVLSILAVVFLLLFLGLALPLRLGEPDWHTLSAPEQEQRLALVGLGHLGVAVLLTAGVVLASIAVAKWIDHLLERPEGGLRLRSLRWAAPALACVLFLLAIPGCWLVLSLVSREADFGTAMALLITGPAVCFAGLVTNTILLILGIGTHRYYLRDHEAALEGERRQAELWERAREDARRTVEILLRGGYPPETEVFDFVLQPGERCFFDRPLDYARFYSMEVSYHHTSGLYFGPVGFVAAASAVNTIGNIARRQQAARLARAQWRDHQTARVLITDRRMIVRRSGEWIEFPHESVVSFHPEPDGWYLAGEYRGTSALHLSGAHAPTACALLEGVIRGRAALERHPAFRSLVAEAVSDGPGTEYTPVSG